MAFLTVPITIYFIAAVSSYIYLHMHIHKITMQRSTSLKFLHTTTKYIYVFIVMWTVPVFTRYWNVINGSVPTVLSLVAFGFVISQGLANSIVWMTSPAFMKTMRRRWDKITGGEGILSSSTTRPQKQHYQAINNNDDDRNDDRLMSSPSSSMGYYHHQPRGHKNNIIKL
eukprot:TRINITY_DN6879_c0_g1_i4.p1 TRINITY_DN6879_c0_g1~~TRINITY_DN6879_c0_g1_i4.p1  ORF type:complete len:190 (+),score=20.83 TRINITY_DN6879_c0_g1_i4:61-570(+)